MTKGKLPIARSNSSSNDVGRDESLPQYTELDTPEVSGGSEAGSMLGLDGRPVQDEKTFQTAGPGMSTKATMREDGTIGVTIKSKKKLPDLPPGYASSVKEYGVDASRPLRVPVLNIVIFIVGSRGDVQPYLAAALALILDHGHRVRIATHDTFEKFVLDQAVHLKGKTDRDGQPLEDHLEFYGVGGDPRELMAYMVKNPGLLPGLASLTNGDIGRKQKMIKDMIRNFYRSTYLPCPQNGAPFAAEAIISNPPAFAHIHAAEALGIPLTMSFTMPWSATTAFSHPLVAVEQSDTPSALTSYLTFGMASGLTWQGLGRTINKFRKKRLGLDSLSMLSGASVLDRLKIPFIYCWTAELIPKPDDWMQHIDVTGFLFLESPAYKPEPDLSRFLSAGPPPIYIGFGSIVVEDPARLTRLLLESIKLSGVRALLSIGWSKIGGFDVPDNVFLLGDCPHDWLFAEGRVSGAVIHGGAGTTAIALKNSLPVAVVPFFGDQPFWGAMIHNRGAGPEPIPYKALTAAKLASAIKYLISPPAKEAAEQIGAAMRSENGALQFADAFHAHLPLLHMRCDLDPSRVAVWWSEKYALRLSALAVEVLIQAGTLNEKSVETWRPCEYATRMPATDPISGGAVAVLSAVTEFGEGFFRVFTLRPDKGFLMMVTAAPKALVKTLTGLTEGLETLPSLYGTQERRPRTKVKNASSGFVAGGKGFAFGFYDGLSGLVLDPMRGAQAEGSAGFAKGLARASLNLAVQPAAGMFGLFSHPVKGIGKSIANAFRPGLGEVVLRQPRRAMGKAAAGRADEAVKREMMDRFKELAPGAKERRKRLKDEAKRWLKDLEMEAERSRHVGEAMQDVPGDVEAVPPQGLMNPQRFT